MSSSEFSTPSTARQWGRRTLALERLPLWGHRLPLQTLVDYEVGDAPILLDQSMCKLAITSELRGHPVEAIHPVDACWPSDYPMHGWLRARSYTDPVSDFLPCQLLIPTIRRPDDATVLVGEVFEEIGALGGPLVARHVDEPERQRLLVRHAGSAGPDLKVPEAGLQYRSDTTRRRGRTGVASVQDSTCPRRRNGRRKATTAWRRWYV